MAIRVLAATPPVVGSTFTLTSSRTDPLAGETWHLKIEGDGGHTGYGSNQYVGIGIWVDYGDPSSTFERTVRGSNSANVTYGRDHAHVYEAPGTYTVTITSFVGLTFKTQTIVLTVGDVENLTIKERWYVDIPLVGSGDMTGAPAASASVIHITTNAEWEAKHNSTTATENVIIYWKADNTHHLFPTNISRSDNPQAAAVLYSKKFGAGARPKITVGAVDATEGYALFTKPGDFAARMIFTEVDFDGRWNPLTSEYETLRFSVVSQSLKPNTSVSFYRCAFEGMNYIAYIGDDNRALTCNIGLVDCFVRDCQDYGFLCETLFFAMIGCDAQHSTYSARIDDGKNGTSAFNSADHSFARLGMFWSAAFHSNIGFNDAGWSGLPPEVDTQTWIRFHQNEGKVVVTGATATVAGNEVYGRVASYGGVSAGNVITAPTNIQIMNNMVWGNRANAIGQGPNIILNTSAGGMHVFNNVMVKANLKHSYVDSAIDVYAVGFKTQPLIGAAARSEPSYVGFNTIYSEAVVGRPAGYIFIEGGEEAFYDITVENNLLCVPDHSNGGLFLAVTTLSPVDDWKAVTGSAADVAPTGTIRPKWAFDNVVRDASTKQGAHQTTVGSRTNRPDPSLTGTPTIALISGLYDQYHVTDAGPGTNIDPRFIAYDWLVNGTQPPDPEPDRDAAVRYRPYVKVTGAGGVNDAQVFSGDTIQCIVTISNLSGTVTTAASNIVTHP